jgi:hypothetical protein
VQFSLVGVEFPIPIADVGEVAVGSHLIAVLVAAAHTVVVRTAVVGHKAAAEAVRNPSLEQLEKVQRASLSCRLQALQTG